MKTTTRYQLDVNVPRVCVRVCVCAEPRSTQTRVEPREFALVKKNRSCRRRLSKQQQQQQFKQQKQFSFFSWKTAIILTDKCTLALSLTMHSLTHTHTHISLCMLLSETLSSPLCFRSYFTLKRPFRCTFNGLFLFSLRTREREQRRRRRRRRRATNEAHEHGHDTRQRFMYVCVLSNSPHCGSGLAW